MKAIHSILALASLTVGTALEKRQGVGASFIAAFPDDFTNVSGASQVSGSFTFIGSTDAAGGVEVAVAVQNFPAPVLNRRQLRAGLIYQIFQNPSVPGCPNLGSIIPGGDMSALAGPLVTDPTSFSFFDPFLSTDPSSASYIGGHSVVISFSDGTVIACATIVALSSPPDINVIVNVNIDINISVTISVCPICAPLTTVVYEGIYVPYATTLFLHGNYYECNTAGWYTVICPYTVQPGHTTTIQCLPTVTYTDCEYTTQTVVYTTKSQGSDVVKTTTYTHPTSIYIPTSSVYTPVAVTTRPVPVTVPQQATHIVPVTTYAQGTVYGPGPSPTVYPATKPVTYPTTGLQQVNTGNKETFAFAAAVVAIAAALL